MTPVIGIVALLGLLALSVVGAATFIEVRPVVRYWRQRRRHYPWAYQETVQIIPVQRFSAGRKPGKTGYVVSLLVSAALLVAGGWEWSRFDFRGEWRRVDGVVESARVVPARGASQPKQVVLRFRYAVDGREFVSQWADDERGPLLTGFTSAEAFAREHRPGQPVAVWYHPLLPTYPSLVRVTLWYALLALAAGGFLLVTGSLSLLAALRPPAPPGALRPFRPARRKDIS